MRLSSVALLVAASLLFACYRPGPASPEYAEAREKWSALLREKLDGAAADPGAEEVLSLLGRVDPKSVDAPYAAELKKEIETSRSEATARAEASAQLVEQAEAALRAPVVFASDKEEAPAQPPEPAVVQPDTKPDAGVESQDPKEGMDAAEFKTRFARCFEYNNDSLVGGVAGGQVWGLKDLGICRDLYPSFTGNAVLLFEGKVAAIRSKDELAPKKYVVVDGKLVPFEEAEKLKLLNKPQAAPPAP